MLYVMTSYKPLNLIEYCSLYNLTPLCLLSKDEDIIVPNEV